jgi:hypothetical protein
MIMCDGMIWGDCANELLMWQPFGLLQMILDSRQSTLQHLMWERWKDGSKR